MVLIMTLKSNSLAVLTDRLGLIAFHPPAFASAATFATLPMELPFTCCLLIAGVGLPNGPIFWAFSILGLVIHLNCVEQMMCTQV